MAERLALVVSVEECTFHLICLQVSIELIKVISHQPLEKLRNAFLSLALPSLVFCEPAPPIRTRITEKESFTVWDRWEVRGSGNMKLKDFLKAVKVRDTPTLLTLPPTLLTLCAIPHSVPSPSSQVPRPIQCHTHTADPVCHAHSVPPSSSATRTHTVATPHCCHTPSSATHMYPHCCHTQCHTHTLFHCVYAPYYVCTWTCTYVHRILTGWILPWW